MNTDKPKNRHQRRRAEKAARTRQNPNSLPERNHPGYDDDNGLRLSPHERRHVARQARAPPDSVPECMPPPSYDGDLDAYDIATFCKRHSISVSGFYQMKREGWGPDTFYCGKRQLISREAAERWRREREAATAAVDA